MFRNRSRSVEMLDGIDRLERWIREGFALAEADIVLITEDRVRIPGYPDAETRTVFWKGEQRYRLRFFNAAADVVKADLPPAWLLPTLLDDGDFECC